MLSFEPKGEYSRTSKWGQDFHPAPMNIVFNLQNS